MDYSLHILIVGCTLVLAWWIRQEHRRHAQHLIAILSTIRDILKNERS